MFPTNFFLHWPKKSVKQYENQPIKSSSNHSNFQKNQADSTDMLAALYWMRSQEISQVTIIHPEGDVNVRRCFDNLSNNSVWTKVVARLTNWCCHLRAALRARSWGHDLSVFNYCCGHTCALVRFFSVDPNTCYSLVSVSCEQFNRWFFCLGCCISSIF